MISGTPNRRLIRPVARSETWPVVHVQPHEIKLLLGTADANEADVVLMLRRPTRETDSVVVANTIIDGNPATQLIVNDKAVAIIAVRQPTIHATRWRAAWRRLAGKAQ